MALSDTEKEELSQLIETAIKAGMAPVASSLQSIQRTADLIKEDLDHDRQGIAIISTGTATIERLAKELLDMYSNIVRKVGQKAEEKTEQAIEKSTQAVVDMVEPVMAKAADKMQKNKPAKPVKKVKKHWWSLW